MTRHPMPRLLAVTRDEAWYCQVCQAVAGKARPRRVGSLNQLDDLLPAGAILVDGAAVPDVDLLATWLRLRRGTAMIAVAAPVPEWRDAVTLMRSGAFDYFSKTHDLPELGCKLQGLLRVLLLIDKEEGVDGPEAQAHSVR